MTTPSVREAIDGLQCVLEKTLSINWFNLTFPNFVADITKAAAERDALKEENERIRKILSFVPAQAVIEAKEKAGYGTPVRAASISFGIQPNEDEDMFKGRYEDNIEWPK